MSFNTHEYCAKCGRHFRPGQTRYAVLIDVVADFDGVIETAGAESDLESVLRAMDDKTEEELMNEVAQKLSFTLCQSCRDQWVSSPLGDREHEPSPDPGQLH